MGTITLHQPVVILANGCFPRHSIPVKALMEAKTIICCDGAVSKLSDHNLIPHYIVGDMDSITPKFKQKYADIIFRDDDQETNDLTKAINFCLNYGVKKVIIIGATGKYEDHSIANISLLTDYAENIEVEMITDHGRFTPVMNSSSFESYPGQKISIFCIFPETSIQSEGLKYPLHQVIFNSWWKGSLNEATGDNFRLDISKGKVILFRSF
jgi:thiamine pyrophosphokinase